MVNVSQTQVQKWAEKRRNALLNPSDDVDGAMTFESFVEGPLTTRHLPTLADSYRAKVDATIRGRLLPTFGKLRLSQIKKPTLDDYLASLRPTCEPKAQRDHIGLVQKFLTLAVEWELLAALPIFPRIRVPKADVPEFLTPEEHETLLTHARDHEEYTLLLFATDSGTRSGEQLALRWRDIRAGQLVLQRSLKNGTVASGFKGTKSGNPRVLPLSQRCEQALAKLKAERTARTLPCGDDDLVFGSYIESVKALYKRVVRACKRAGVKHTSRHGLRHTHASWLISSGKVSLAELQDLLGHSSPTMTLRYAHLIPGTGDNVRAVLDGLSNDTNSASAEPHVDNGATTGAGPAEPAPERTNRSE
jgi:integrase